MEEKIISIMNEMAEYLSVGQMKKLQEVLLKNMVENEPEKSNISNSEYLRLYLAAKQIEGCSERTIQYYMGHASLEMTRHYDRRKVKKLDESAINKAFGYELPKTAQF